VKRSALAREHLDGPLDPALLDGNLRDLARINRRFGGVALTRRAIASLAPTTGSLRVLDIGTGAADIPVALLQDAAPGTLDIVGVDHRPEIVAWARDRHGAMPGLRLEVADGTALPWPDAHFDIALASMVLHHLEPPDAVRLLGELRRVVRRGVVVNDLDRGLLRWLGAWLLLHLVTGNRYTRHDGPMSVRRAYRPSEVTELAGRQGLVPVACHRAFAGHRYAIAFGLANDASA
jgi:ubiquinone/menaquinone biosynthesis C-methylase UbiE